MEEDLKNVGSKHQKTVKGASALKKMHDAPGVMAALSKITKPAELTQVLEALLDAVPVTSRADILKVLRNVTRHEKKTRMR